ncbi:MAG: phosphatase PAP2 family protein [Oscillospiraceae bacterium]
MQFIQNLDDKILQLIQDFLTTPIMDKIMIFFTNLGEYGAIWFVIALILMIPKKNRKCSLLILISVAVGFIFGNVVLKSAIGRIRPCNLNLDFPMLIPRPTGFSCPSGHSISSFAAATAIFIHYKPFGNAAFIVAFLIAFSRMYLYVHYPSDIIFGSILGIIVAILMSLIMNKIEKNSIKRADRLTE